ncbi:MAG: response regulator transcription factor [Candidatus Thorarchaeota archaeon]|nr:response regulator transcription factor [Candidatus Thorarchaeota archaeon]
MTIRIFLIDDEPAVPKLVSIYLRGLLDDFEVMTSASGEKAVTKISLIVRGGYLDRIPHITVLDYKMPGMGGLETTTKLKELGADNIYILTAYLSPGLIEAALQAGAKGIMKKSEGFKEIARKIAEIARAIQTT